MICHAFLPGLYFNFTLQIPLVWWLFLYGGGKTICAIFPIEKYIDNYEIVTVPERVGP